MRRMKSRVAATWVCSAALALLACSSSDTLIALNVNSKNVGLVSKLHVTVTQGTKTPFVKDFEMIPTKTVDNAAGAPDTMVIADKFYERFTLPGAFGDGKASLDVEAFDKDGNPYLHPPAVEFELHEHEATAVFVNLEVPTEPPPPMGGTGGTGGTGGGMTGPGGAGGNDGGTTGTDAGAGGTPVTPDAGSGGAP